MVLITSGLAGAMASFITNPLDLIKLRLQLSIAEKRENNVNRLSLKSIFLNIYKQEGIKGLFRGATARVISNFNIYIMIYYVLISF